MKLACTSDLHGNLPDLSALDFDALLIGGDICPATNHTAGFQATWLDGVFRRWLSAIGRPVFAVAGNHDFVFEDFAGWPRPSLASLPWTYLQDSGATLPNGMAIYGTPWQPRFHDWAFSLDESDLCRKWAAIPGGTDVLLLHGPPHGHGDFSPYGKVHTGSPGLTERIRAIEPRLAVSGHIHSGYGADRLGDTLLLNVAHVDEGYRPVNPPIVVEIDDAGKVRVI